MNFFDKNFSAAIFDMDGTMFDTERLRFDMLKKASIELMNVEISDELLYDSLGVSAVTAEKYAKEKYGENYPYKEIRVRADELEIEYVRTHGVPVKKSLYNLLERLKKNNIFIALATSSRHEIAEEYLIKAKVYRYFDILVCGDEVKKGKPDPEIFIKAASELLCPLSECLIFEDSQNGLLAAADAGGIPIFIKDMKEPKPEIKKLAYRSYNQMTDFLKDFTAFTPKSPMPHLNEYFPLNEENITVGIHGFGAIGGGYLAPIFSHWDGYTRPNHIIGAARNPLLISLVNALGKYRIRYEKQAYFQTISNIEMISMNDEAKMLAMYEESTIIGLSLPENAIRHQAGIIAKGLLKRYENGGSDLTILIVMNKINAAKFVRNHIRNELKKLTIPANVKEIISRTCFIETVVNRMVTSISEEFIISKLRNDLYQLHHNIFEATDQMNMISDFLDYYPGNYNGDTEQIKPAKTENTTLIPISISKHLSTFAYLAEALSEVKVTLFSAESDMALYASSGSSVVEQLCQVVTVDDISSMQEIKNKLSNGTHAIIAWYSTLLNYKTIGQGMGDVRVKQLALDIMNQEIRPALLIENPEDSKYINKFIASFIIRCRNSFRDNCSRVGRDVMRKLQNGERIIGAIQMAQKYGIAAPGLEFGAACAILCCVLEKKPFDSEAKKVKSLYEQRHLVEDVLIYDGEYNKGKYNGLDKERDKELIARIQYKFDELKEEFYKVR